MSTPHGSWVPDELAPSGYRWARRGEQPATTMLPLVSPSPVPRAEQDDHHDLELVHPDEFLSFDTVDSQMIRSIGAPE